MLFTPKNAQKVVDGLKTQTRRPCQDGDEAIYDAGKITIVLRNGRKKWQVGHIYSINPGRGKSGVGFLKIKSIRQERVNEISEKDALAEGVEVSHYYCDEGTDIDPMPIHRCNPIGAFRELWNSIYSGGMAFDTGPMAWALEFEVL